MSKKPNKSRKEMYDMPMHKAAKQVAAHLDEKLQKELGRRSITLRKGDTVKVLRGSFNGKEGKITSVDRGARKIFIEKLIIKKSNGKEIPVKVDASNVLVIDIDRTDRKRTAKKEKSKESEKQ
ncbi:MAG: 50S ribosomal protein L24 [archaeon]